MIWVYYDYDIESTQMEFLHLSKDVIKSFIQKKNFQVLDYNTVTKAIEKPGILIMLQDVMPYSLFNVEYDTLSSLNNNLARFIKEGGIFVWLGDVPFFYRVRCYESDEEPIELENLFKEKNRWLPHFDFFSTHLKPSRKGKLICYRDIISTIYIEKNMEVKYLPYSVNYLKFFNIGNICYLNEKKESELTLLGKALNYNDTKTHRPLKATTSVNSSNRNKA
ncbi:hypothetical protein SJAV_25990 [Sulfurisphaera javensis]|uniref:Uncharacterized protein n=1 Tax=Sulfurisphaera javensis TaxID=2049879 RepID=A0AAT9GUP2_9CREN